jgi:hypothetical protein
MTKGQLVQSLNSLLTEDKDKLNGRSSTEELRKALEKLLGVGDDKLTLVENNNQSGFRIEIKGNLANDKLGKVLKAFNNSSAEADSTLSARGGPKLPSRDTFASFASAQNEVDRLLGQFGLKVPALKG